jgi:Plavaka transposase
LVLSMYSDKSQLSSFGTVKAYPVILRILNVHSDLRNTAEFGGGLLVGLLPHVCSSACL